MVPVTTYPCCEHCDSPDCIGRIGGHTVPCRVAWCKGASTWVLR